MSVDRSRLWLNDGQNFTGYSQVLEEYEGNSASSVALKTTFTLGDDVISQSNAAGTRHLLYDGHGSTRTLTDAVGSVTDTFHYDAYGVDLAPNRTDDKKFGPVNQASTSLRYSGEWVDDHMQQQYLRARWYDPGNAQFGRLDDYGGNPQEPQSLHKYAYCHNEPVMGTDPRGKSGLIQTMIVTGLITALMSSVLSTASVVQYGITRGVSAWETAKAATVTALTSFAWGFLVGAAIGAFLAVLPALIPFVILLIAINQLADIWEAPMSKGEKIIASALVVAGSFILLALSIVKLPELMEASPLGQAVFESPNYGEPIAPYANEYEMMARAGELSWNAEQQRPDIVEGIGKARYEKAAGREVRQPETDGYDIWDPFTTGRGRIELKGPFLQEGPIRPASSRSGGCLTDADIDAIAADINNAIRTKTGVDRFVIDTLGLTDAQALRLLRQIDTSSTDVRVIR